MTAAARARLLPAVIVALLALAALRAGDLWIGLSAASAEEENAPAPPDVDPEPAPVAAPPAPPSEAERRLLTELAARRAALEEREAALETREALLDIAETRLDERFAELVEAEKRLTVITSDESRRKAEEFAALSSAYARMRARDAARIFDVLEDDILVPVAAGMRAQSLSGVLAEMEPDKARALTRLLAERHRAGAEGQ